MTKKKRNHPGVEEILSRPWCYYCERDFDDLKILINHQKAKHFKCERCGRRLNTAGGLSVHMSQVHKENLTTVENALPNRAGLDIEIFGMEGIPEDVAQQHNQRVLMNFHQAEADRRAMTGNTAPGAQGNNPAKKPKFESPSDLKKRLAEHKAAKLAAEQNGDDSGASTPTSTPTQPQPPSAQTTYQAGSPPTYSQYQQQGYAPPPSVASFSQPPTAPNFQAPGYGQPPVHYPQTSPPPQQAYGQPPHTYQQPYGAQPSFYQPPQPNFQQPPIQPPNSFPPAPFPGQPPFSAQPYPPQVQQNGLNPYPGQQVGAPRAYGAGSPHPPFPQHSPHAFASPPPQSSLPQRSASGSLPSAPGLPQRPAVGAPPVNALQFQQMHQGQIPTSHTHALPQPQYPPQQNGSVPAINHAVAPPQASPQEAFGASSLDDLISDASKQADAKAAVSAAAITPKPATPNPSSSTPVAKNDTTAEDKAVKKDKDKSKPTRLVYSDNEISPEEKMAALPKYAFTPSQKTIQV